MAIAPATLDSAKTPGLGLLVRLKLTLLRNRLRQLTDQSPLQLLLIILFVGVIWGGLYLIFDHVFVLLRRHREQAIIAIPYVFHLFFASMMLLLAFSTAVLVYGGLFGREEPALLLSAPNAPQDVVAVMYAEALFFSSWSLVLLGLPLMLAIGQAQDLPWHFYPIFLVAFLGFVPIPGALGLLAAWAVALYLPRVARRTVLIVIAVVVTVSALWWGRLWSASSTNLTPQWLEGVLGELRYVKAVLLPSSWVARAIQRSIENKPADAAFYLAMVLSTALFLSYWANMIVARRLMPAFSRAHAAPNRSRKHTGWLSYWLTEVLFFYLPAPMRALVLKDVRSFLRDPVQWSQLAILFGLLSLYLFYLPRSRPEGFSMQWQTLICFLNYGAITLILSTFTSRFVFPMISMEGRQIWLMGLWPVSRARVMWAKFLYALAVTAFAAMTVSFLSIRALSLPIGLAVFQAVSTLATCIGLCGLAIGLGAKLPSFDQPNSSRIASGLGGTVNLIASVGLVVVSVGLFGAICWFMLSGGSLNVLTGRCVGLFVLLILLSLGVGFGSMQVGLRSFRRQEF